MRFPFGAYPLGNDAEPISMMDTRIVLQMLRMSIFAVSVAVAAPAFAQPATLATVSAHLAAVTTMTADFSQIDRNGKSVPGKLLLKRPGHVRFQYAPGVQLLIVGDGKALTMIDYSVKQVSRWPVGDSPLSVLTNPKADLARFATIAPSVDPNMVMVQAKDPKHPEFGTITLVFSKQAGAPAGLMMEGWTTFDAQGNRSTVRLSNQQFNTPISDKAFRWNDPRPLGPRR
jgi:outer membrane lipoprotein-sorting protein